MCSWKVNPRPWGDPKARSCSQAEIAGSVATGIGTAIKASRTKAPTAAVAAGPARRSLRNQGKIAPVYKVRPPLSSYPIPILYSIEL